MSELPPGWTEATIGEVAEVQLGKMLDKVKNKGEFTPYLRNINVRWGAFDLSDLYEMRFTEAERESFTVRNGDLLICEGGEPGRSAVWRGGPTNTVYQKALHRVRAGGRVDGEWIARWLKYLAQCGGLEEHFTGTTIKHLPAVALRGIPIPLPSLAEQRRIVAKIDALNTRSKRARDELESISGTFVSKASALLDRLEQAILTRAFRGELVAQDQCDEAANGLMPQCAQP